MTAAVEGEDAARGHHRLGHQPVAAAFTRADRRGPDPRGAGADRRVGQQMPCPACPLRPVGIRLRPRQRQRARRLGRGDRAARNRALADHGARIEPFARQDDFLLAARKHRRGHAQHSDSPDQLHRFRPPAFVTRAGPAQTDPLIASPSRPPGHRPGPQSTQSRAVASPA
ncbi:hypothetical protein SDC9_71875 [bioreactor metagenome]|uniref:Uncharacterized protein n=1 Tax=bioreactor metagenome TaxID=1076179 RepID=A0A644YGZ4_9ZZZZ